LNGYFFTALATTLHLEYLSAITLAESRYQVLSLKGRFGGSA
jgi:hypothetical protein